jgi:hypothetical protein
MLVLVGETFGGLPFVPGDDGAGLKLPPFGLLFGEPGPVLGLGVLGVVGADGVFVVGAADGDPFIFFGVFIPALTLLDVPTLFPLGVTR